MRVKQTNNVLALLWKSFCLHRLPSEGVSGSSRVPGPYLKTTALKNSCTCTPGDMYKYSLIPQIFIKHPDIVNVLNKIRWNETKPLPTWSLHCNWQNAQSSVIQNSQNWKQSKPPWIGEQINKLRHSHTMEHYTVVKTNEIHLHA